LPAEVELVDYRVAQEALTNVARHAGAAEASLELASTDRAVVLVVGDRGRGLPAGQSPGAGIRGMRERAGLIGAELTVGPQRDGGGCRVELTVPVER
jgi:two-component system sensor histidine kinase UhpB